MEPEQLEYVLNEIGGIEKVTRLTVTSSKGFHSDRYLLEYDDVHGLIKATPKDVEVGSADGNPTFYIAISQIEMIQFDFEATS